MVDFCEELYKQDVRSPFLLSFLIDLYEEKSLEETNTTEQAEALAKKAMQLCILLMTKYDVIRQKYWEYVSENIKMKFQNSQNTNENNSVLV